MYPAWLPDGIVDIKPDKYCGETRVQILLGTRSFFCHSRDERHKPLVSYESRDSFFLMYECFHQALSAQ